MATNAFLQMTTPIVWADTTDYSSTGSGYTRTAQIDLTSLADTNARQGDKVDLGTTLGLAYAVHVGIEFGTAPTAGDVIHFRFGWSHSVTDATGNSGGLSGSDSAYKNTEEEEWINQLTYAGSLTVTNDAAGTVQRALVGTIQARERYIMPVVLNKAGQTFDTDAIQMYIALVPIIGTDS